MSKLNIPSVFLLLLTVALVLNSGCDESTTASTPLSQTAPAEISPETASETQVEPAKPPAETAASKPLPDKSAPDGVIETSFDDLELPMERGDPFKKSLLTPKVESLFGQKIRLRGFMLSTPRKSGLKEFVLIRDDQQCCFGPGSFLFHSVLVRMQGGATAEYTLKPITVEGTFRFDEFLDPISGNHLAIYAIDGVSAE